MNTHPEWLTVHEGDAPVIVSFPHTGSELPHDPIGDYHSPWLARRDADWWVHELYDFVRGMGATTVRSAISRSVIDLNRDPSGSRCTRPEHHRPVPADHLRQPAAVPRRTRTG